MGSARPEPLSQLDGTAQAALVARGEATPRELIEAAIERIERVDDVLGAVPIRVFDAALAAADELGASVRTRAAGASRAAGAAPFAGVPFLMKDVGARQVGHPYYAANRALRDADHRAEADTPLGARFREIGLVTLGSSNTPEFGLQSNTWPLANGPTRNPWNPERSAGGSSGGACAAVAAGLVPIAHASDGAGSIRIPAAWCGLIGLKPSRDRVVWRHAGQERADVEFVVARSLRDTAALLDALRPEKARLAAPTRFCDSASAAPRMLRIGFCATSPAGNAVEACVRDAVERTVAALARRGHPVDDAAPGALFDYWDRALFGALLGPLGYRECLDDLAERLGRPVESRDVEPYLWTLAAAPTDDAEAADPDDIQRAMAWTSDWERSLLAWFEDFDLLVTPTVHEVAPELESLNPRHNDPLTLLEKMVPHMVFTEPWNATGQPAISLPLGWSPEGLPVGVQLVGRRGAEGDLLATAAQLLEDLGEPGRHPRVHA